MAAFGWRHRATTLLVLLGLWSVPASAKELSGDDFCAAVSPGRIIKATPKTIEHLLGTLLPGDTLRLQPGHYAPLYLSDLRGAPGQCIIIAGPDGKNPAVIDGAAGRNTVEILNSSYLALRHLVIDSRGIDGAHGVSAKGKLASLTHHIVVDDNLIVGAGAGQQTDGISTKTPTWNWLIRRNRIVRAGTGLYLGDSNGSSPFVAGIIEGNLVIDPIGYCMEVKYQVARPSVEGMPTEPLSTIIRDNVFIKSDRPSPDGDRPNLLVGGFPQSGSGSHDRYQIYRNFFFHNPREALFQASGQVSFHDNLLVGGAVGAFFSDHDLPLKSAVIYNNTIYTKGVGIRFGNPAHERAIVVANLVFATRPFSGLPEPEANVMTGYAAAGRFVEHPSEQLGGMDFHPRRSLSPIAEVDAGLPAEDVDSDRDFDGARKVPPLRPGAYAGRSGAASWRPQAGRKPLPR